MNALETKCARAYEANLYKTASEHEANKDVLWPEEKKEELQDVEPH